MSDTPIRQATESDAPLQDFSKCHVGFVTVLGQTGTHSKYTPRVSVISIPLMSPVVTDISAKETGTDTNFDFIHDRDIVCRFTDAFNRDYDSHEKLAKNGLSSAAYPFENRCDKLYRNEINILYDHQGIHKNSCTDGEGLADFHRPDTVDGVEYRHEPY